MSRLTRVKKATTIASTFAIALGIGFVMQYGDANAARYNSGEPVEIRKPVLLVDYAPLTPSESFDMKPEVEASTQIATTANLSIDADSVKLIALVEGAAEVDALGLFEQTQPRVFPNSDCEILAVTAPDATGSVLMTIVSDCRAGMPFTINHSGLTFSAMADSEGTAVLSVPALAQDATFFITFEDGKSLAASTYAPKAALFNRVIFQWEGHVGDYLHALGADVKLEQVGENVGEIPRFAEIYSFPADMDVAAGLEAIDLTAHVTVENCGQDLVAESFTIFPRVVDLTFKDIRITLPACDAVGATLELKKVLGEQTLAGG
jgi:hypothetical protein